MEFETRTDFANHLREHQQATLWACIHCGHADESRELVENHLASAHTGLSSGIAIVEKSVLRDLSKQRCPFCNETPGAIQFVGHVCHHLEEISLAAVPQEVEIDDDDEDDGHPNQSFGAPETTAEECAESGEPKVVQAELSSPIDAMSFTNEPDLLEHHISNQKYEEIEKEGEILKKRMEDFKLKLKSGKISDAHYKIVAEQEAEFKKVAVRTEEVSRNLQEAKRNMQEADDLIHDLGDLGESLDGESYKSGWVAQTQAQAQAQAQAHAQAQQGMTPQHQMFQQQIVAVATQLYNQQKPLLLQQYFNGMIPEEADKSLRLRCQLAAQRQVQAGFRARRQQQMMAAQGGMQQMIGRQN